ncbi:hypothetical protein NAEGRDRAFT_68100 [Naegleria gruberi]|uniref:Uncharacterized protein n=1 Tax=Naegleria gruberi TaxID=5762 RepID=D2VGU5_NAEGR|nr:uncharacterized protein NAEGRDRAFT_68100 [Naegleria gruberi]EFC44030.1 hypothetical protein NAEGRDRAFT_68100 [Naegleria gruberi]|eukprot:XP_002676774.1 hypothetical protein NAEGRDRAFT_68100 [Naegleria gruberi strain NEG-M]
MSTLYQQVPKYIIQDELTNIVQKREEKYIGGKIGNDVIPRHLTICNQSRECIYFSEQSETLYYIDARQSTMKNIKHAKIQKILKTDLILRNIKQISYNSSGNRLLVISDFDINVISIPEYKSGDSESVNTTIEFSLSLLEHSSQNVKVSWHPLSNDHIVALDSDSILRIIQVSSGKIEEIPLLEKTKDSVASFSFGSKKLWERFTIYLTTTTQALFALCPIIPSGCVVSEKFLADIVNSTYSFEMESVKHFFSGIISNVSDDEENREVTLKTSTKENHAFKNRIIPIHNKKVSNLDIADMITINQNSNLPSCLVTVNTSGVIHLFVITDNIRPVWKKKSFDVNVSPQVIEASCIQEVLTGDKMNSSLPPYLTLHPLSIETVYCVHERGANEITFPFISTMFTEKIAAIQFEKTVSCPLFISTELYVQFYHISTYYCLVLSLLKPLIFYTTFYMVPQSSILRIRTNVC